eukprot:211423_1
MLFSLLSFAFLLQNDLVFGQTWIRWANEPPSDIPFPQSTDILEWEYLNNSNYYYSPYGGADTWFPTWSNDGNLHSGFADGTIHPMNNGVNSTVSVICYSGGANWNSTTGYVTIIGDHPNSTQLINGGSFTSSTYPYRGRYPCGSIYFNNTWFYGTYSVNSTDNNNDGCGNWCEQGPFVGYRWSTDFGKTWIEPRLKMKDESDNIFHENNLNGNKVKYGAPHVIDFGQELKYSPDGKFYIIGHGANTTGSPQSWMQGDQVYIARNIPDINHVNDSNSWEFYSGNNIWSMGDVSKAKPLFTWLNRTGEVTMTYFNVLKKYIMCVSTPTYSPSTIKQFDTYFLESDNLIGPWKYIIYMNEFGPQAYFVNYPSKFLSMTIDNDNNYEMYLSYSANWKYRNYSLPVGSGYHWSLQRSRFKLSQQFVNRLKS